jgi:hypothetical protein
MASDETTNVGKWLKALGADKCTKVFFEQGYKELEEVTKDVIERLVEDKPLAAKLIASATALNDLRPGPTPQPGATVNFPPLPARAKLDLSRPTVKFEGIPEFTIPSFLSVSADTTAVTQPGSLSQVDWMVIARDRRVLHAYTMGRVSGDDDPPQALMAALDWMIPDGTNFRVPFELDATVETEVTYSAGTASYVRAGVDKQQASVGFPFAAASFEREHEERHAVASSKKQLQLIGRWYYPRVKLILQYCTAASDRFIKAVTDALNDHDRTSNLKPLLDVFRDYGIAFPAEITLGGQLIMVHKEDYQGTVKEDEVKDVISAAVSLKTTKAEGSASASFQNGLGSTVSADQMSKATKFTAKGGDTTKTSAPEQWPNTVKPCEPVGRHRPVWPDLNSRMASEGSTRPNDGCLAEVAAEAGDLGA